MSGQIAGIVLAAGASTRLGVPKQLVRIGTAPLLHHTLEAARAAPLDLRVVVLGGHSTEVRSQVRLNGFVVVENPDFLAGQSTSVRAAISALPAEVKAAIFILGDQPEIQPEVIGRMIQVFRRNAAAITQPRYREGRGNPVLISRVLFEELLRLQGDTGARPLLEKYRDQIDLVDASDVARPGDIDTAEDVERIRTRVSPGQMEPPR